MLRCVLVAVVSLYALRVHADKLDGELTKAMQADHVPGLSVAVVKNGRVVKLASYGVASVEHRAKVTPATRFEIASMSKMFIATAIRILADEGKLDLEDPVSKYFDHLPATWKAMRVRHLVAMSAGLPEDWDLMCWCDVRDEYDDKSMLDAFIKLKLLSPIGERFHYNSPGYAMLGMIVTKITGKPFQDFVAQRVFAPAGLTETSYNDPTSVIVERADGYRFDRDAKAVKRGFYVAPYMHARADVGILTTPRDLAKWIVAVEAGKVVKDPERLFASFSSDDGKHDLRYGYGWISTLMAGRRAFLHTGGFRTGFSSFIVRAPDERLTMIMTMNCAGCGHAAVSKVLAHYLQKPAGTAKDPDAAATTQLIKALQDAAAGKGVASTFAADALTGIGHLLPALKDAPLTFKARHDLRAAKVTWHGQALADYVTLRVKLPDDELGLELYRDDQGVVRDVEIAP
jgi:D-alanyl-D-alanine carboxypeptidase